jgi:hypothetical protein
MCDESSATGPAKELARNYQRASMEYNRRKATGRLATRTEPPQDDREESDKTQENEPGQETEEGEDNDQSGDEETPHLTPNYVASLDLIGLSSYFTEGTETSEESNLIDLNQTVRSNRNFAVMDKLSLNGAIKMLPSFKGGTESKLSAFEMKCEFVFENVEDILKPTILRAIITQLDDEAYEGVFIMNETSEVGWALEVDVTYPQSLHDDHNDLPYLPEDNPTWIKNQKTCR